MFVENFTDAWSTITVNYRKNEPYADWYKTETFKKNKLIKIYKHLSIHLQNKYTQIHLSRFYLFVYYESE